MKPRRHDPVMAAILAEIDAVNRTLGRLRVPASARDDLRQMVLLWTWREAWRGRVAWWHPPSLRGFLRVVTARAVFEWWEANPIHGELRLHEPAVPSAEGLVIARSVLRLLRTSTTPERWRAIRAYAKGITVREIAQRERVPQATIYDRMRRARLDFAAALRREDASIYVRRKK